MGSPVQVRGTLFPLHGYRGFCDPLAIMLRPPVDVWVDDYRGAGGRPRRPVWGGAAEVAVVLQEADGGLKFGDRGEP